MLSPALLEKLKDSTESVTKHLDADKGESIILCIYVAKVSLYNDQICKRELAITCLINELKVLVETC